MTVARMDHFTIVTDCLQKTLEFYALLGLEPGPRPQFRVGGAWLYAGGHAVLHVVEKATMPEPRRGVLDHMAYFGHGLQEFTDRLDRHAIAYRIIRTPEPFDGWQVFFEDPNGCEVEVDFAATEAPPAARVKS